MQNNQKKLPSIIILLILTLITILFWISFSIYSAFSNKPEPVVTEDVIKQLDPKLDIETINIIRNKI
ncbi:MAG: hypothetical protein ACD_19C00016G0036 [uncultured bacterium]|nr:MAG: hypothetical protein ACD_19C00016G0036 [uncultured bacterium]